MPDYEEFVVPWGALHLPGIEASIEEMGFERTSSSYTPLISWARVTRAILGTRAEREASTTDRSTPAE